VHEGYSLRSAKCAPAKRGEALEARHVHRWNFRGKGCAQARTRHVEPPAADAITAQAFPRDIHPEENPSTTGRHAEKKSPREKRRSDCRRQPMAVATGGCLQERIRNA